MAGRLMGQLQAAARTSGISDLIDLMRFLGQVEWAEELEAFQAASQKAEEAAAVIGSVEEIEVLRDEASTALSDALVDAEEIVAKAAREAGRREDELDVRDGDIGMAFAKLDIRDAALEEAEADIAVREEKLATRETHVEGRMAGAKAEWDEAHKTKGEYEELIAQVKAALPGTEERS